MTLGFYDIRRNILIGLFSDDELFDTLVLEGGNALALIHKVANRISEERTTTNECLLIPSLGK
jgi:hypothetical protein